MGDRRPIQARLGKRGHTLRWRVPGAPKRSQIAIRLSAVYGGAWIGAGPRRRLRIAEGHLEPPKRAITRGLDLWVGGSEGVLRIDHGEIENCGGRYSQSRSPSTSWCSYRLSRRPRGCPRTARSAGATSRSASPTPSRPRRPSCTLCRQMGNSGREARNSSSAPILEPGQGRRGDSP